MLGRAWSGEIHGGCRLADMQSSMLKDSMLHDGVNQNPGTRGLGSGHWGQTSMQWWWQECRPWWAVHLIWIERLTNDERQKQFNSTFSKWLLRALKRIHRPRYSHSGSTPGCPLYFCMHEKSISTSSTRKNQTGSHLPVSRWWWVVVWRLTAVHDTGDAHNNYKSKVEQMNRQMYK